MVLGEDRSVKDTVDTVINLQPIDLRYEYSMFS